jgi:hypothetical protein
MAWAGNSDYRQIDVARQRGDSLPPCALCQEAIPFNKWGRLTPGDLPHPTPPLPCHPTPSQIGVGLSDFPCVPLCPLGWVGFAFPILAMPRDAGDLPHPSPHPSTRILKRLHNSSPGLVWFLFFRFSAMTCDHGDVGDPSPPWVIPDWRRLQRLHSIWRRVARLGLDLS